MQDVLSLFALVPMMLFQLRSLLMSWMPAFMPCYGDPRWVLDTWMVN